MPSRKRNQGRARKAKAAGGAPYRMEPRPQTGEGGCRHGCTLESDHISNAFVGACYDEWDKGTVSNNPLVFMQDGMNLALKKYPINRSDWDHAKSRFVEDGVKIILRGDFDPTTIGMIAAAILFLESENSDLILEKDGLTVTDILDGCKRTAIRYFSKRIPCSCLDDLYAEAKETLTKI